jgi:rsbT co-antagonist protein RsbR
MEQTIDSKVELSEFLNNNLNFYTQQWLQYLGKNKSHITTLIKINGVYDIINESGDPIMRLIADHILSVNTEEIKEIGKEWGAQSSKFDFPIHYAWEAFQCSRIVIWNAIKAFYNETDTSLTMDEFFHLERTVNDIIDLYIDSFTAYYVQFKDDLLDSHRQTVDDLSVPIIPITEKVCILPVVGNVDTYRAKKIRERTLLRVKELKAEQLIIDISGVPFVDTAVVNHLFKIVNGIKLFGCSTILTGISPEIADTMIELGIEIGRGLKTKSDLQQALQEIQAVYVRN